MKRITIITAILFTAFTLNAQSNRSRSENTDSSEPARKEEVKRTSRSAAPTYDKDKSSRERKSETKQTTRPANQSEQRKVNPGEQNRSYSSPRENSSRSNTGTVDRQGNRTTYLNRGTESPRVRVEHPNNGKRVENIHRGNEPSAKYSPKRGERYEAERRTYTYNHADRVVRPASKTYYAYKPIEYRRVHYVYRVPPRRAIVWNAGMYREYTYIYPEFRLWYYPFGYHIHTISAYNADRYVGEVARVYGEVYDTWYSSRTDEYYLYIGGPYPYQDFTIVLEGRDARRFSSRPARHFSGRHVAATGLIGVFEGKPEMFIKKRSQIEVY